MLFYLFFLLLFFLLEKCYNYNFELDEMCVIRHNLAKTQRSWCNATKALRCNHTYLMLLRIFGRKFLTEHVSGKSEIFLGHPGHVYHKSLPFRAAGLQRFIQKTMLCTSSVQPKESSQMPIIFASWRFVIIQVAGRCERHSPLSLPNYCKTWPKLMTSCMIGILGQSLALPPTSNHRRRKNQGGWLL